MSTYVSKAQRRPYGWILARYLFPLFSVLVTVIFGFIPCLRYISIDEGTLANMSLWEMLSKRFKIARINLFGGGEELSAQGIRFSKTELGLLILFAILALLALLLTVYVTLQVLSILRDPQRRDSGRIFFVTLVPNRTAYCLYQLLFFPLLFYPRLWLLLIRGIMDYPITLHLEFAEPWMIALGLFTAQTVLSVISARMERRFGVDPFRKKLPEATEEDETEPERRSWAEVSEEEREEKSDRIRRLLAETQDNESEEKDTE